MRISWLVETAIHLLLLNACHHMHAHPGFGGKKFVKFVSQFSQPSRLPSPAVRLTACCNPSLLFEHLIWPPVQMCRLLAICLHIWQHLNFVRWATVALDQLYWSSARLSMLDTMLCCRAPAEQCHSWAEGLPGSTESTASSGSAAQRHAHRAVANDKQQRLSSGSVSGDCSCLEPAHSRAQQICGSSGHAACSCTP